MPLWSVLLPVRNGETFIERAVSSTLSALPRDAELLVMDDGSTDATPAILDRLGRADARLVVHRRDGGMGVARALNELAARSDSEFVGRMDADDVCLPGRWHVGRRLLGTHDMVFMAPVFIDSSGRPRGTDQPGRFSADAVPFHLLLGSMLVHPTAMMRRDVFASLGGYRVVAAEDYDLWLRATADGHRIVRSVVPGLLYRRHEAQVTKASPWETPGERAHLWNPYSRLSERLGVDLESDSEETIRTVLGREAMGEDEARKRERILDRIARRADSTLPRVDRPLLRWRLARERRRTRERVALRRDV